MRGEERRQRALLMIMEVGDRVPREHPLRRVKELADAALTQLSPVFDEMYSLRGRPSIPPEAVAEGLAADGALCRAQRTDVLRATRLQPVVPLVPRYGCGRAELRPFDLLAQPRAAVGARRGARVFHPRGRAGRGALRRYSASPSNITKSTIMKTVIAKKLKGGPAIIMAMKSSISSPTIHTTNK